MKAIIISLLFAASLAAQFSSTAYHIGYGAATPASCSPSTGDIFFVTNSTPTPYYCSATNTWSAMTGSSGITNIATTSPITGGPITTTGTIACATCVVASSPGAGVAHFAGSTQT